MKLNFLLLFGVLIMSCSSLDDDEFRYLCEQKTDLGNFFLSEKSLSEGLIYDQYNIILFKSERGDTMRFIVEPSDTIINLDQNISTTCDLDSLQSISFQYSTNRTNLNLTKISSTIDNNLAGIGLSLFSKLHEDNPKLGLNGDFIGISTKTTIPNGHRIQGVLTFPIEQRSYPINQEDYPWGIYHQELMINGQIVTDVYTSVPEADVKVLFNQEGFVMIEEPNGVDWFYIGYE